MITNQRTLKLDSVVIRSDEVVASDVDGEVVMMSVERGEYYGLDDIASRIWHLIEEPRSIREICEILFPEYDAKRERIEQDVLAFFQDIHEDKLIRIVE
jgi:hypothetical protein